MTSSMSSNENRDTMSNGGDSMKNGGGSGGGNSGETIPLLSTRSYDQNGGQYVKSQQQSSGGGSGGPIHSYHPNQANSDPILMAQYAAAASAGNPMAAYAFAAAAQYDQNDYGATAANGYNGGYMPAGPYGAYYAAPYAYGAPVAAGQPGAGSPQPVPIYYGNAPTYIPVGSPMTGNNVASNMAPPSRPPRVTRRSSGGARLSPSPTSGTLKKTYVPDNNNNSTIQQQQNSGLSNPKSSDSEEGGGAYNINSRNAASNSAQYDSGSGLPPLTDIFTGGGGEETLLRTNSGGSGGGGDGAVYGATTSTSRQRGSGGSSRQQPQLQQPVMVRTLSSGDMGKKSHPFYSNSSGDRPSKPSNLRKSHRRANSDTPLRAHHRRGSSGNGEMLPPKAKNYGSRGRMGSRDFASGGRSRTFSGGAMGSFDFHNSAPTIGLERQRGPRHRRADSASSIHTFSSNYSVGSIVSDIGKSAMFGGVTESGTVQLHKPLEAIRLVVIGSDDDVERATGGKKKKKGRRSKKLGLMDDFQIGKLYKETMPRDPEMYEDYHRITTDIQQGLVPNWETMDNKDLICNCTCNNCNGCTGKQNLLPQPTYALTVKDDIYKRVLSEIADSQGMPCGLFFCGHHEDVSHPSIMIAVVMVGILFASMALVAYFTRG